MDFELSVCVHEHCVIVRIDGESDAGNAAALRESLLDVLATSPVHIVLDLSGLGFLDCAGARALVAVDRRATLLDGALAMAALTAPVARLFQVTGLGARLAVFPALDAALAAA